MCVYWGVLTGPAPTVNSRSIVTHADATRSSLRQFLSSYVRPSPTRFVWSSGKSPLSFGNYVPAVCECVSERRVCVHL